MAMNFVTFNQDYSYLAVGKKNSLWFDYILETHWLTSISDVQRVSNIHNGSVRQKL